MTRGRLAIVAAVLSLAYASGAGRVWADDLQTAREALRDGMWRIALEKASAAEAAATDASIRTAARLAAIEALVSDGRPAEALARIERAANLSDEPENDAMRYTHAWVLSLLGRNAEALELVAEPLSEVVWRAKGEVLAGRLLAGKDEAAARKRLAPIAKMPGAEGDEARFILAGLDAAANPGAFPRLYNEIYNEGKDAEDRVFAETAILVSRDRWSRAETNAALAAARAAVARAPDAALKRRATATLAKMELHQPSTRTKAIETIRDLTDSNPDTPEAQDCQLALADSFLAAGLAADAAEEYLRALELGGDAADENTPRAAAVEGRAWALKALGRNSEAAAQFALAARYHAAGTDRARAIYAQADALLADGLAAEAAQRYLAAAAADPETMDSRARFAAAGAMLAAGDADGASAIWQSLASADGLAAPMSERGLPAREASGDGRAAPGQSVWPAESHLALAVLDEKASRAESAAAHAAAVLAMPNLPPHLEARALAARARACYQAYRFAEAASDFAAAARLEPSRAEKTRFLVALCRFGEGRDDEARAEAERLAAQTKDAALKRSVLRWLARLDYNTGDWTRAAGRFAECAATSKIADDYLWAARSAFAGNEFPQALEFAAKAVDTPGAPKDVLAAALTVQGEALIELARYDEAVLVLDRALVQTSAPDAQRRLAVLRADAIFAMGADNSDRWQEAMDAYRAALELGEPSEGAKLEIAYKIARSLEKLHREEDAAREYYLNVVLAYVEAREKGVWFDAQARAIFARSAFALADHHESRGDDHQAAQILKLLSHNAPASATEARRRLSNLRRKGRIL